MSLQLLMKSNSRHVSQEFMTATMASNLLEILSSPNPFCRNSAAKILGSNPSCLGVEGDFGLEVQVPGSWIVHIGVP